MAKRASTIVHDATKLVESVLRCMAKAHTMQRVVFGRCLGAVVRLGDALGLKFLCL